MVDPLLWKIASPAALDVSEPIPREKCRATEKCRKVGFSKIDRIQDLLKDVFIAQPYNQIRRKINGTMPGEG